MSNRTFRIVYGTDTFDRKSQCTDVNIYIYWISRVITRNYNNAICIFIHSMNNLTNRSHKYLTHLILKDTKC